MGDLTEFFPGAFNIEFENIVPADKAASDMMLPEIGGLGLLLQVAD